MQINTPPYKLNELFNAPNGGSTLNELSEVIVPTFDVGMLLRPIQYVSKTFTGTSISIIPNQGIGIYRLVGSVVGYARNGVNAGAYSLAFSSTGYSTGYVEFATSYLGVSEVKNYDFNYFDLIFDFSDPRDVDWSLQLSQSAPAAFTASRFNVQFALYRIS